MYHLFLRPCSSGKGLGGLWEVPSSSPNRDKKFTYQKKEKKKGKCIIYATILAVPS